MNDEELPKTKAPQAFPRVLEGMSVASMREYIGELQAEIVKVNAEIAKRDDIRSKAESLFKS